MEQLIIKQQSQSQKTDTLELRYTKMGELLLRRDGESKEVFAKACFPWSHPYAFISLRNTTGEEVVFVEALDALSGESQKALNQAIKEQIFAFEIIDIWSIKEEFELRVWEVKTKQGPRTFQTSLTSWPVVDGEGQVLIKDINSDLYVVKKASELSDKAEKLLWSYTD